MQFPNEIENLIKEYSMPRYKKPNHYKAYVEYLDYFYILFNCLDDEEIDEFRLIEIYDDEEDDEEQIIIKEDLPNYNHSIIYING